jgi:hypothetical protein
VMAMMFHAFNDEDREGLGDLNTAKAMKMTTLNQKVQMEKHHTTGQWLFRTKEGRKRKHAGASDAAGKGASSTVGHGLEAVREAVNDLT